MIFAENTPNNVGVAIYGDYEDFNNLYDALHAVVGDEDEFAGCEAARIRVLAVCYDIRHALMGHRGIEFVDNGIGSISEEIKKYMGILAPDKNVYLKIYVLWPEMLFVMVALNEFLTLYAQKQAKTSYSKDLFAQYRVIWDSSIAYVRMLQAAVAECLKKIVPKGAYARMLKAMNDKHVFIDGYIDQYIDILNDRFIRMSSEKRLKNISIMAKRIVERNPEYLDLESQLVEEAKKQNCSISELRLDIDYPEDIEW